MKTTQERIGYVLIGLVTLMALLSFSALSIVAVGEPFSIDTEVTVAERNGLMGICVGSNNQHWRGVQQFTVTDTTDLDIVVVDEDVSGWYICSVGDVTLPQWSFTPMKGHNYVITDTVYLQSIRDQNDVFLRVDEYNLTLFGCPWCGDGQCTEAYYDAACGGEIQGEDINNCPADCWLPPEPFCGDNICNGDETCTSCPQDCGECPQAVCGDGVCTLDENWQTCPQDCLIQGEGFPMWLLLLAVAFMIGKQQRWW